MLLQEFAAVNLALLDQPVKKVGHRGTVAIIIFHHIHLFPDINECESLGDSTGCEQICVNTIRSYTCACREGYTLGMDGGRCVGRYN